MGGAQGNREPRWRHRQSRGGRSHFASVVPLEQLQGHQDFCFKSHSQFIVMCVCTAIARILQRAGFLSLVPRHHGIRNIKKTQTGQNPGKSRQTEEIRQAVNLLEGTASEDRFVHPASCCKSTFVWFVILPSEKSMSWHWITKQGMLGSLNKVSQWKRKAF